MTPFKLSRFMLAAVSAVGCTAGFVPKAPVGDEVTIFVHGYKGSLLRDGTQRAWISPGDVFSHGDKTLALPFEGERAGPMFGPLTPEVPFTRITILPWLLKQEGYLPWLDFGSRTWPGFVPFAYDWRQDIRVSAAQLAALIDRLAEERQGRLRVNLIGHSMGGLVTLYYLRYGAGSSAEGMHWAGARRVQRAVFVGVPFQGAPDIFDDLLVGTKTGLNKALLSREALFTFASSFQLLPGYDDFFVDSAGASVKVPVGEPATWRDRSWGVFEASGVRSDPAYLAQITRMLTARRELHQALADVAEPPPDSLKSLVVVGRGRKAVAAVRVKGDGFDFEHPLMGEGDGSVLVTSAAPPRPLAYTTVETKAGHVVLLNDDDVQKAIVAFLR